MTGAEERVPLPVEYLGARQASGPLLVVEGDRKSVV